MIYSNIPSAQSVVSLCKTHHIEHIVISPGSRNAPLIISFTHDAFFTCYSIVDERCAAFFALGIAQQIQKPVAVVCTSGSALLNYYPAISEAYYSNIPIVILSADRPKHLVDIGDGQTINQNNVFEKHVHYSTNLKLDLSNHSNTQNEIQQYNETEIHSALSISTLQCGPVHINLPFDEPLYNTVEISTIKPIPYQIPKRTEHIDDSELNQCIDIWQKAKRKLILVGVLQPNSIKTEWLQFLAEDNSVIVFTETTSNLHHSKFFPEIDKLIAPLENNDFMALQPEVLLTFGGMIVSKKIKAFLRQYQPKHHWHIDIHKANDTFHCLEKHFKVTPNTFFFHFLPKTTFHVKSNYKPYWLKVKAKRRERHQKYTDSIPFSDFKVFNTILEQLPQNNQLQIGNSSAIRYTQLFQLRKDITVFCNRGTSGIDGSTSTAIGASVVSKRAVTFITGDLSFFYDSNALWNNYIPDSFRIIVINNAGGGIFRILPGHKNTKNFDTYFETKHQLTAKYLCKMYNFEYSKVFDENSLNLVLNTFFENANQPKLLEIVTPSEKNDQILSKYFKYI